MKSLFVIAVAVASAIVSVATAAEPVRARFSGGLLAVEAADAPLDTLLAAIGEHTGAQLEGRPEAPPTISASLPPTPLDAALARLFPGTSVAVTWGQEGRPSRIRWLGRATAPATSAPVSAPPDPAPAANDLAATTEPGDASEPPSLPSPRAFADLLRSSPELERKVRRRLRALDDGEALAALRNVAPERAEGILRALADSRELGVISRRAARILEQEAGR